MARTIQSPGVQISEVDLSLRANLAAATNILIPGFAPKGPSSDPVQISTLSEFEQIFGTPTNAAERYFYQTAKAVFQSPANVTCYRIPYGNGAGLGTTSQYSALVYPVVTATLSANPTAVTTLTSTNLSYPASASGVTYFFGAPTHVTLAESDYLSVLRGDAFTWSASGAQATFSTLGSLSAAGLIVLNKAQASVNSRFEGTYIALTDNTALNPATQFDDFNSVQSVNTNGFITPNNYVTVPSQRLTFSLSATTLGANGSISEVVENIPTFDTSSTAFNDTVNIGVFKLRQSVF